MCELVGFVTLVHRLRIARSGSGLDGPGALADGEPRLLVWAGNAGSVCTSPRRFPVREAPRPPSRPCPTGPGSRQIPAVNMGLAGDLANTVPRWPSFPVSWIRRTRELNRKKKGREGNPWEALTRVADAAGPAVQRRRPSPAPPPTSLLTEARRLVVSSQ